MPRFAYQAEDSQGALAEGTLEADSLADALAHLSEIGLTPRSIRLADEIPQEASPPSEPVASNEAIQRLLVVRDYLAPALSAYTAELPIGRPRRQLRGVANTLRGDESTIRSAVAGDPLLWAPLLESARAEDAGASLTRFFDYDQREREGQRRWRLASYYPLFLLTLFCAFAWPFSTILIPSFGELYQEFGLELPAGTVSLLAWARFIESGGAILLLALAGTATIAWQFWPRWVPRSVAGRVHRVLGVFGVRSTAVARQTRQAGALLHAGVSPDESAHLINPAGDLPLRPALAHALGSPMPENARPELLHQLDPCYEDHAKSRVSWRRAVVGPGLTITLGILIGYTVVALFVPLVSLIENLS